MTNPLVRFRVVVAAIPVLLVLDWAAPAAQAQIVNTLEGFDPAQRGLAAALAITGSVKTGNTETLDLESDGRLQWQSDTQRFRAIVGFGYEEADRRRTAEDTLVHLRHNRRLTAIVNSLVFGQWQRDPFQRLQSRVLVGAGARFDLVRRDRVQFALGVSTMLEVERLADVSESHADHRGSSFFDLRWKLSEAAVLTGNGFFQPLWNDLSDLRAIGSLALESGLGAGFSLVTAVGVTVDTEPPDDVEETDWEITTGLRWRN